MKRAMLAVVGGLLLAAAGTASADPRSTLQILAENPGAKRDPRIQRALIEEQLAARQPQRVEVEYSTPYLPATQGDRDVDVRIRRIGELMRRQEIDRP